MTESDERVIADKKKAISTIGGLLQRKMQERTKLNVECQTLEEAITLMKADLQDYETTVKIESNE